MKISFNVEIVKKGKWFIVRAPELDFVTQGRTVEEARYNIIELIEIQFEEMREMGTLKEFLEECGFSLRRKPSFVSMEKRVLELRV